jgi:hypothetical protein
MLSPVEIATWVALCIPWAEPRLASALVEAGSGREAYLVTEDAKPAFTGRTPRETIMHLRAQSKEANASKSPPLQQYIGLMQIPTSALRDLGLESEAAIDKCTNLAVGYQLFLSAYDYAGKVEKSPWKRTAVAYNFYRNRQTVIESEYSKRAVDYLMKAPETMPANMADPIYHSVMAEWSAGLANRQGSRQSQPRVSLLAEAGAIARWARTGK